MPEPPRYPGTDADQDQGSGDGSIRRPGRGAVVAIALVVGVVVVFAVLHLTGVAGPGGH